MSQQGDVQGDVQVTRLRAASKHYGYGALLLSGSALSHPSASNLVAARNVLQHHGVECIINVSSGVQAMAMHLDLYSALAIHYVQIPIDDTEESRVPANFLHTVLQAYANHSTKTVLVNCSAGINRSALAAAVILWTSTNPRPWKSADELIFAMRQRQRSDRGLPLILENRVFQQCLREFIVTGTRGAARRTPAAPSPP